MPANSQTASESLRSFCTCQISSKASGAELALPQLPVEPDTGNGCVIFRYYFEQFRIDRHDLCPLRFIAALIDLHADLGEHLRGIYSRISLRSRASLAACNLIKEVLALRRNGST